MGVYPKFRYHADLLPVQVNTVEEEAKYPDEAGWSNSYIRQEWPKSAYGPDGAHQAVKDQKALDALGDGWTTQAPEMKPPSNKANELAIENARLKAELDEGDLAEENAQLRQKLAERLAAKQAASGPSQADLDAQARLDAEAAKLKADQDAEAKRKAAQSGGRRP